MQLWCVSKIKCSCRKLSILLPGKSINAFHGVVGFAGVNVAQTKLWGSVVRQYYTQLVIYRYQFIQLIMVRTTTEEI